MIPMALQSKSPKLTAIGKQIFSCHVALAPPVTTRGLDFWIDPSRLVVAMSLDVTAGTSDAVHCAAIKLEHRG
jgi:hypothetical protein